MRVELEIFSGQPNPAWELSTEEDAQLLQMLNVLPKGKGGALRQGLGYRGFTVINPTVRSTAEFNRLTVSNGTVLVRRAEVRRNSSTMIAPSNPGC